MASDSDTLLRLKGKLDELESVIRMRLQPRGVERAATLNKQEPSREPLVAETSKEVPTGLRAFITRFFGGRV